MTTESPHPSPHDLVTKGFVAVDRGAPGEVLDGDVFFLDCLFTGHFGHLATEVVSRL